MNAPRPLPWLCPHCGEHAPERYEMPDGSDGCGACLDDAMRAPDEALELDAADERPDYAPDSWRRW